MPLLALSLALMLLAVPGFTWTAEGFDNSQLQAQLTAPSQLAASSYRTIYWTRDRYGYRYWREDRDYDRPYYYGYYDPYYPYPYYYDPGFSVDVPFFHFHVY